MEAPIVKEVRDSRQRIFKECGEDLDRYIAYLKTTDAQDKHRLVTLEEVRARLLFPGWDVETESAA
jgi:hypothetical protein